LFFFVRQFSCFTRRIFPLQELKEEKKWQKTINSGELIGKTMKAYKDGELGVVAE
jgi:hypothetical protein